jgi:hypothetical protein
MARRVFVEAILNIPELTERPSSVQVIQNHAKSLTFSCETFLAFPLDTCWQILYIYTHNITQRRLPWKASRISEQENST